MKKYLVITALLVGTITRAQTPNPKRTLQPVEVQQILEIVNALSAYRNSVTLTSEGQVTALHFLVLISE